MMLELEYDGSEYFGFQVQPEKPTIQGEIEKALFALTNEEVRVTAAGRTDTGVHAKGQVVSFQTTCPYSAERFVGALNFYLPDDITVTMAAEAPPEFDARRSAIKRSYRYYIFNRYAPSPFWRRYAYHFPAKLDLDQMREAATTLVGEHDFAAFAGHNEETRSTVREVYEVGLRSDENVVIFSISANAFLTHQVRNTVGTLLWVGTGKASVEEFVGIMDSRDRRRAGPTAPPTGLFLMKVSYAADSFKR